MKIEEAIQHCKEKAKELSDNAYAEWGKSMTEEQAYECNECAREHEQLAIWLEELVALRKLKECSKEQDDITYMQGYIAGCKDMLKKFNELNNPEYSIPLIRSMLRGNKQEETNNE